MTRLLRAVAVLIAIAGIIDPVFATSERRSVRVDVLAAPSFESMSRRVIRDLGSDLLVNTGEAPDAVVIVGSTTESQPLPRGVPVSVVTPLPPHAPNVRLVSVTAPDPVVTGQNATVEAGFDAVGMIGESSTIELRQGGVRLASVEHRWTRERERFTAALQYVPSGPGLARISVLARPLHPEASGDDNAADVAVLTAQRTLHVAVYEPRPSWRAAFIRRAIESDPLFALSTLVSPSRGHTITAGPRLGHLSSATLAPFDAVVVGAPEELTAADIAALRAFCELRGGAVILIPDRQPSGPYTSLVSSSGFDEAVLDKPVGLVDQRAIGISASEFALPRTSGTGAVAMGSLPRDPAQPAIVSITCGRGRLVFSGALDDWRFRAAGDDDAFARFWTGIIANLAAAAPRRLEISVQPALAAPGERLTVRVALAPTAFAVTPDGEGAAVSASLIAGDGTAHFVRVWPAAEPGIFEGEVVAPGAGSYDARVSVAGAQADTPVVVATGVRHPPAYDDESLSLIASSTGGVIVDAAEVAGLRQHLLGLSTPNEPRTIRPMRTGWWSVPFALALCSEWALRRRHGDR
jgi:hypothetical protein